MSAARRSAAADASIGSIAFVLIWALLVRAEAMWKKLTREELLETSELIVIGEVVAGAPSDETAAAEPFRHLQIEVQEVLKGDPLLRSVTLAQPRVKERRLSTDIVYQVGDSGLWYLRRFAGEEAWIFLADHPQRFVPEGQLSPSELTALRERLR